MLSVPKCNRRIIIDVTGDEDVVTIVTNENTPNKRNFEEVFDHISISIEEEPRPTKKKLCVEDKPLICANINIDEIFEFYTPDFFDISLDEEFFSLDIK